jgi:hypothetical protein
VMRGLKVVVIAGALLLAPATTAAAQRPVAATGGAANIQPTTVVLNGAVNPRGAGTTYFFQYGTTRLFGASTPATSAGAGNARVRVAVPIGGLAPFTTYHYRLVAQNARGLTIGARRTFRTRRQPLGVSLAATPNPVNVGGVTTLSGVLSGTGNGGRDVVVKSNPWPYTQGFLPVGNTLVTNPDGSFSQTIASVPVNTQFLVQMPARPDVVSPIVVVGTTAKVTRSVSVSRGERRGRLRFRGRITPAVDGRAVLIQKLRRHGSGGWFNVGRTFARSTGKGYSTYRKTITQRRAGRYRVLVDINDVYSQSSSRSIKIRRVRR